MTTHNTVSGEPLSEQVARRLRALMAERQLRGTEVAAAIGMTQGSFSRRFTGSAPWELDELQRLESAVGISVAYLLGFQDTDTGSPRRDPREPRTPDQDPDHGPPIYIPDTVPQFLLPA